METTTQTNPFPIGTPVAHMVEDEMSWVGIVSDRCCEQEHDGCIVVDRGALWTKLKIPSLDQRTLWPTPQFFHADQTNLRALTGA